MRARTTVLPREDLAAYNRMVEDWNGDCRPRTPAERALVLEIANAQWKLQRVESAQDERVAAGIGDAGTREDVAVFKKMERLFWDPRGPISSYGLWPLAQGGPPTSWSGQVDDPNQPYLLVKELEASAKGCQALLDEWAILRSRVENNLPWQPPDRLKAIRMLGKQPIDVAIDRRIAQIYLTTYAMHPLGQKNAYDDLKCDLVTIDFEPFLDRIRKRWPRVLHPHDTDTARQTLLDLIERSVERLEGIRDAHLAHAGEVAEKTAKRLAIDTTTEGERLARYEMQCRRRFYKCLDAFWKHRSETIAAGQEMRDSDEQDEAVLTALANGENGMVEAGVAAPAKVENKNVTSEANLLPDAFEVEANQEVEADDKIIEQAVADVFRTLEAEIRALVEPLSPRNSAERLVEEEFSSNEPPPEPVG